MEYVIHEQPKDIKNDPPREKKPKREYPVLDKPILEKPEQGELEQEDPAQLNIDINNTLLNQSKKEKENTDGVIINPSITNQSIKANKSFLSLQHHQSPFYSNAVDMLEACKNLIYQNIEYEILIERYDKVKVDEYVGIMLDAICSRSETVRIDRADYPVEVVKSRLLKLDCSHIEYVLDSMAKNTTKIHNIKNYILTALYNSYNTLNNYYQGEVNYGLYGKN